MPTRFEAVVDISAPPARVWEAWTDLERWPEWTSTVTSAEWLTPDGMTIGARARIRQPRLPVATWEVTELIPGARWVWVARGPGVETVAGHYVQPMGTGARAVATVDQRGPGGWLIGALYGRLTDRYVATEVAGLRARAEAV
jgi:uncharacterized membrane protein